MDIDNEKICDCSIIKSCLVPALATISANALPSAGSTSDYEMNTSARILSCSESLTAALINDPFYVAITVDQATQLQKTKALKRYFEYSMQESVAYGRCVTSDDGRMGASLWHFPCDEKKEDNRKKNKMGFISDCLGSRGVDNYIKMTSSMSHISKNSRVCADWWYLSILGVHPDAQNKGTGSRLLTPILNEADRAGAVCYLETFNPATFSFYERHGFMAKERFFEPVCGSNCWVMERQPKSKNS